MLRSVACYDCRMFLAGLSVRPWRWQQDVPPKRHERVPDYTASIPEHSTEKVRSASVLVATVALAKLFSLGPRQGTPGGTAAFKFRLP
jgi:hypothetical protein